MVLLIINFFQISAFANIIFNVKVFAKDTLSIEYNRDKKDGVTDTNAEIINSGYLIFGKISGARYWQIKTQNHIFNLVRIDLSHMDFKQRKIILQQLANYIEGQDTPSILYGNFGESAWSPNMRKFLKKTGLKVKNHLIFAKKDCLFNLFSIPDFHVLGFANLGVNELHLSRATDRKYPTISLSLGFE